MKHTPGPWVATSEMQPTVFGPEYKVCEIFHHGNSIISPETIANAKLIAAAPALLDALKWLVKDYEESDFDVVGKNESLIETAKYVIKKATE